MPANPEEIVLDANVLVVVRDTAGRLNVHDAMIVVLQREGRIGAVATFDEALATTPGFVRATI